MDWLEFSVTTDSEVAEAIVELFTRHSRHGAVVEIAVDAFEHELAVSPPPDMVVVKTYLPLDGSEAQVRDLLEQGLWHLGQIRPVAEPEIRHLTEEDWAENWKKQYHPLHVGQRMVIVPAWQVYEPAPGEVAIRLEPGMAFGTGLHPTTRLCLEALETHLISGARVLDVGTGSGVLAIAAAMLGAESVLALDIDSVAVSVARENVRRNDVSQKVTLLAGSLPGLVAEAQGPLLPDGSQGLALLQEGQFDLVLVNILARVIVELAPALAAKLAPGGQLIVAGLIDRQEAEVVETLGGLGLDIVARAQEEDWVRLVAQRE